MSLVIRGPGIAADVDRVQVPTGDVNLVPTLFGLVGADPADLLDAVAAHRAEVHPLPGRDLADVVRDRAGQDPADTPIYFMA